MAGRWSWNRKRSILPSSAVDLLFVWLAALCLCFDYDTTRYLLSGAEAPAPEKKGFLSKLMRFDPRSVPDLCSGLLVITCNADEDIEIFDCGGEAHLNHQEASMCSVGGVVYASA